MLATITSDIDPAMATDLLYYLGVVKTKVKDVKNLTKQQARVFVNGKWVGTTTDVIGLADELRQLRRTGKVHEMTSIRIDYRFRELHLLTTGGRFVHPWHYRP